MAAMAALQLQCAPSSCFSLNFKPNPKPFPLCSSSTSFLNRPKGLKPSLSSSSNLSALPFPVAANFFSRRVPVRRSVVCEAATGKKPDSAEKRARQAEKRRIRNKAKKSELKTRMRKVFEELDVLKKKNDAQAEEILPIEKLIAEAYSAIDKAVKLGTLHRNTGAHRKSRLARGKKSVEIHHGWYTPVAAA